MIERLFPICLKHVDIEEFVPLEIHACQHVVVERHFSGIHVFGIARSQEHAIIEEHVTHSCTGLVVRVAVGKHIGRAESFDSWHRA